MNHSRCFVFLNFWSSISSFSSWSSLFSLSALSSLSLLLLMGCGAGMKTLIRLRPLQENDATIKPNPYAVTREKDGVKITVTFYDRARLEGLAESIANNPFLSDLKTLCTVFHVEIENQRPGKILVDPQKCVILDGVGNQLNGLSVGDFERWYPSTSTSSLSYSYVFNEYTPTVVYTPDFYKRKIAREMLLKGGELYPGVKQTGLVAFEPVKPDAMKVTLVLPIITEMKGHEVVSQAEFTFQFAQEISPRLP